MSKVNSKTKLFVVTTAFAVFAGLMFTFGYSIVDGRNQQRLDLVNQKNLELEVLEREQHNFEQGKRDLASIRESDFPPEELFSNDTRVVSEIRDLEALAESYNLEFTLSISGTTETAIKATGVNGELLEVPYAVSVSGSFNNILKYLEATEHTVFINHTHQVQISARTANETRALINSKFYLKP